MPRSRDRPASSAPRPAAQPGAEPAVGPLERTTRLCQLLSDSTRVRLLSLLADEALSVAEITQITRLPQPRVSTHLQRLREAGLVQVDKVGALSFYRRDTAAGPEVAPVLQVVLGGAEGPMLEEDRRLVREVVEARRAGSSWVDAVAGRMARHYSPGRTWESLARGLSGLMRLGRVIDLGSGDGAVAELLAPYSDEIVCVDHNPRVVEAASGRADLPPNLRFHLGDVHHLDLPDASFDEALVLGVLPFSRAPARLLAEAARVLKPGGRLVCTTLRRHPFADASARYDHCNPGHEPEELAALLEGAGLRVRRCHIGARERRPPHFEVVVAAAYRPAGPPPPRPEV